MSSSQSARSILQRSYSEESEILISSASSSDGENEILTPLRDLITQAQHLLTTAEQRSQPEDYRRVENSPYVYNFSSSVRGEDLFRERELGELIEILSTLKNRLSAERVFSLGCPTVAEERMVFDTLLMRYADELLDQGHTNTPATNPLETIRNNPVGWGPGSDNQQIQLSNTFTTRNNDGVSNNAPVSVQTHSTSGEASASAPPEQSTIIAGPSGHGGNETHNSENDSSEAERPEGGEQTMSHTPHSPSTSSLNNYPPAVEEFLKNIRELNNIVNSSPEVFSSRLQDPEVMRILQSLQQSLSFLLTSYLKCQQPYTSPRHRKRRRSGDTSLNDSAKKCKTKSEETKSDDEDEDSCSICLEPWSTGGDHRITCLKCGHLFGRSCILKWVEQAHCCPQCKAQAKKSDMRNIFVRKITAEDTSQRDRALRLLGEEKVARRNLEQKEAMARKKLDIQAADTEALRAEVSQLRARLTQGGGSLPAAATNVPHPSSSNTSSTQSSSNKRFHQFHRINVTQDGSCRVLDYSKELGMMVASQKTPNALFRGFGIKIFSRDFRPLSYQPLHSAAIRDISFCPGTYDGMLLSCGMDKSVQLTNVPNKIVVQKYTLNSTAWSCAWNTRNTNLFYVGLERGIVKEFDIRRTDSHVQDVMDNGGSPVSSIQYWQGDEENNFQGLLVAHLQSLIFKEHKDDQYTTHLLPHLQASVMGLSLHPSGKFLASFRPGASLPKCRYEVCQLCQTNVEVEERTVSSNHLAVWDGSNMQAVISRNHLMTRPESENDLLAITANHANNTVNVWDFNKRQDIQTLTCYEKAIDIKSFSLASGGGDLLGILTDKDMVLYKWRQ